MPSVSLHPRTASNAFFHIPARAFIVELTSTTTTHRKRFAHDQELFACGTSLHTKWISTERSTCGCSRKTLLAVLVFTDTIFYDHKINHVKLKHFHIYLIIDINFLLSYSKTIDISSCPSATSLGIIKSFIHSFGLSNGEISSALFTQEPPSIFVPSAL